MLPELVPFGGSALQPQWHHDFTLSIVQRAEPYTERELGV